MDDQLYIEADFNNEFEPFFAHHGILRTRIIAYSRHLVTRTLTRRAARWDMLFGTEWLTSQLIYIRVLSCYSFSSNILYIMQTLRALWRPDGCDVAPKWYIRNLAACTWWKLWCQNNDRFHVSLVRPHWLMVRLGLGLLLAPETASRYHILLNKASGYVRGIYIAINILHLVAQSIFYI